MITLFWAVISTTALLQLATSHLLHEDVGNNVDAEKEPDEHKQGEGENDSWMHEGEPGN